MKAEKWKEADYETYLVMIQALGKKKNDYFTSDELLNFPCTDLRTIDRLWVKYSNGRFGFSVQKEIYLSVGGKTDGEYYKEAWDKFGDRVGWKVDNNWIDYSDVTFSTLAPSGHLPLGGGLVFFAGRSLASHWVHWGFFSRMETCKL
ncbi:MULTISPECIES: GUN4 domain-containing protein [Nostocales]|uniref:GUN4 domain-containing protein n=1 Tax=Nostocales TaxID=1161 RepID=UPI0004B7CC47|nr:MULTISPECIES: GUN4 domain-containing protein [Nostocales]